MRRTITNLVRQLLPPTRAHIDRRIESVQLLIGQLAAREIESRGRLKSIAEAEFRVFSQFGEDGVIQYLARQTEISAERCKFIEFGVESYEESSTRFLLQNNNWRGLIMDGSESHIASVRSRDYFWRNNLTAVAAFIDRDNINQLITDAGFVGSIGLLSIDIDGNDYWVWHAIDVVDPVIVIVEYNSLWGAKRALVIPYDKNFVRTKAHYSNLYWGASLKALHDLGASKGYSLVHCNVAGNNAFFVKTSELKGLRSLTPEEAFVRSKFRESRGKSGELTFLGDKEQIDAIAEMPLIDIDAGITVSVSELGAE